MPSGEELLEPYNLIQFKRIIQARRTANLPIICTHDLVNDATDPVLCQIRQCRLLNFREDRVKVVFHPEFLRSTSPVLGLEYDQFVRGCHLGVFPSYYEPWGYTPMECMASGNPAVTSDLAGFGTFLQTEVPDYQSKGAFVISRRGRDFGASADELATMMEAFCQMTRRQRVEIRNEAEALTEHFDWSRLVVHYGNAHALAVQRFSAKR
jgi:glycogen(starch) synthase